MIYIVRKNVSKHSNARRACAENILEPIIQQQLFYDGHSYSYSSKNKGTLYYKSSKYFSSACKCQLEAYICSGDIIAAINSQAHEILPVEFSTNFISEKAIQLELSLNQIYQSLLLKLRELYRSAPYPIPGKSAVYRNTREQRSSIFSNSIQAATLPPLRYLANSQPFYKGMGQGILMVNTIRCSYGVPTRHYHRCAIIAMCL
ncbi:hypothetical protein HZS_3185 [Henneguya salminicola]|nr:hypothetical protein HZS_3185 [Henneguya salminicola]